MLAQVVEVDACDLGSEEDDGCVVVTCRFVVIVVSVGNLVDVGTVPISSLVGYVGTL